MSNRIQLEATVIAVEPLRYTPSGTPVLIFTLEHNSQQQESEQMRKTAFQILAKYILPPQDFILNIGDKISVTGFLNNKSIRSSELVLHIQQIKRIE